MAQEYARLELLTPVTAKGGAEAHEIIVYRPSCRAMTEVLDTARVMDQVTRSVSTSCRGLNGGGEPLEFAATELNAIDGSELSSIITAMSDEADRVTLDDTGDGITEPMVYTLRHPVRLTPREDSEVVHQISFQGQKVKDISDFLDARGETREFHSFMRAFGKPLGLRIPLMTDILIDALDFLDYLVIRRQIMGKLVFARRRWKPAS